MSRRARKLAISSRKGADPVLTISEDDWQRNRQDARSFQASDNGALCSPRRRSGESGERCRGEFHCGSDGRRNQRRGC